MADIAHDGHTRLVRPSDELLHLRLVLLQRYLDNLLTNKPFYTDPAFWLFVEAEDFAGMVREFGLAHQKIPDPPHPARITFNQPPDELDNHFKYIVNITSRLRPLAHSIGDLFHTQRELAQNIGALGKSLSGYLDATAGAEHHPRVIQLIDSLDTMERRLEEGVHHSKDAQGFLVIVQDYIRMLGELQQTYSLKQRWRSALLSLELRMIDTQAALIKSQNEPHRNFERNFRLSESFLRMREEFQQAEGVYETIKQRFGAEMDRLDALRMLELEEAANRMLRDCLDTQKELIYRWELFIEANEDPVQYSGVGQEAVH